jgi:hypothetical protein
MATSSEESRAIQVVLASVDPEWRQAFRMFVNTGEASPEFMAYMDASPACQQAVEAAFNIQADGLRSLAEALATEGASLPEPQEHAADALIGAIQGAMELPAGVRAAVLRTAASSINETSRKEVSRAMSSQGQEAM